VSLGLCFLSFASPAVEREEAACSILCTVSGGGNQIVLTGLCFGSSYDELLQSSDEEEEEGGGEGLSKKERGRLYWKNRRDGKNDSHRAKKEEGKAWIQEGPEDEPLNFMDPVVSKKVVGE